MSYQRARRDWDIPRQGGPEVLGGSRAPSSDDFSRRSLLHPQQEYLGYGHQQQFHEPYQPLHEPFPLQYQGHGPLPEQFPGEKFQPQYPGYGLLQDHYAASDKFQQQFPGHGPQQRFLQEQFPDERYELQRHYPVPWQGGQQLRRYSDPWQLPSAQARRPDHRLRNSSEAAWYGMREEDRRTGLSRREGQLWGVERRREDYHCQQQGIMTGHKERYQWNEGHQEDGIYQEDGRYQEDGKYQGDGRYQGDKTFQEEGGFQEEEPFQEEGRFQGDGRVQRTDESGGEDFGGGKEEQGGSCEKQMLHHSKKEELLEADELLKYNQVRLDKCSKKVVNLLSFSRCLSASRQFLTPPRLKSGRLSVQATTTGTLPSKN